MFVQVVLIAAMLRAYEDHPSRPRLVLIPEALSRRPDVLAAVLRLMRELELQPIVTAPVGAYAIEKAMDYTVRLYRDPETPEQPRCIQKRRLGPRLDEAQSRQQSTIEMETPSKKGTPTQGRNPGYRWSQLNYSQPRACDLGLVRIF